MNESGNTPAVTPVKYTPRENSLFITCRWCDGTGEGIRNPYDKNKITICAHCLGTGAKRIK